MRKLKSLLPTFLINSTYAEFDAERRFSVELPKPKVIRGMAESKILLLCHRINWLSQRFYCELSDAGHEVSVELDVTVWRMCWELCKGTGCLKDIKEGEDYYLFILTRRDEAVCVGALDGAVWIGYMREREKHSIKLPSLRKTKGRRSKALGCEIVYWEKVPCPRSGAKCFHAFEQWGLFSNGMNLNNIENAESLTDKSWRNINAMDDICKEVLTTLDKLTVSALSPYIPSEAYPKAPHREGRPYHQ